MDSTNYSNGNIALLFLEQASRVPDRMAIADKRGEITFSELEQAVTVRASRLKRLGVRQGDRVLLFVPMSIELYVEVLSIFTIGATVVFLDEWVDGKRLDLCCRLADCQAFIAPFKLRLAGWFLSKAIRQIPIKIGPARLKDTEVEALGPTCISSGNETALITFTTGSTGTPKAAKRTHAFLREQFDALSEEIDPRNDDMDLAALPIVLMINLASGISSVIPDWKPSKPEKLEPSKVMAQIALHGVNRITAAPYFIERLSLFVSENGGEVSNVRKLFTGGAPVFPSQAKTIIRGFEKAELKIVYGSTEAEPISSITAGELMADEESLVTIGLPVGKIHSKAEVKIILWRDEPLELGSRVQLDELALPTGKVGEIIVSGSHVLRQYFKNEAAIKRNKIFVDGKCWHRTGDNGRLDDDGQLYLTGRCDKIINRDEGDLYPFIIENWLNEIAGIRIGTLLEVNGSLIFPIEADGDHDEIRVTINRLGIPAEVKFLKNIPRDPRHHSKIDYRKLERLIAGK